MGVFNRHHDRDERQELHELDEIEGTLERIADELGPKHLAYVKIAFITGGSTMQGPVKLNVGQTTKATLLGFDQNGAPFPGPLPAVTYSLDNPALDSSTPDASNGDDIVSLADGVANLTATVQGPNGPLSDTETITNSSVVPVLSSVKIDFSTPTP